VLLQRRLVTKVAEHIDTVVRGVVVESTACVEGDRVDSVVTAETIHYTYTN